MHQHLTSAKWTSHLHDHVGLLQGSVRWTDIQLLHLVASQSTHGGTHPHTRTDQHSVVSRLLIGLDGGQMHHYSPSAKWTSDLCQQGGMLFGGVCWTVEWDLLGLMDGAYLLPSSSGGYY